MLCDVTIFGTKMRNIKGKCGKDLLFHNFILTDYSTLIDCRVVGTIDFVKSDMGPHASTKKSTWNLQWTAHYGTNSKIILLAYCTAYDVGLELVPNTQFWLNKMPLTIRDSDAKPINKLR